MIRGRNRQRVGYPWWEFKSFLLNGVAPSLIYDYATQRYWNSADGATSFPFTATRTSNAMQFDAQGRLVWGPANLLYGTDDLSTNWTISGATLSPSGISAPAGIAQKMTEDTGTTLHARQGQAASIVTGANYTVSIYMKAAERRFALMALTGYFTTASIQIDLTTGAVTTGTGSPLNAGSLDCGNGWWRVWFTATAAFSGSGSNVVLIYCSQDGVWNNRTYTGDGVSGIHIAAPKLELSSVDSPQPYVASGASNYYGPRFDYDPVTLQPRGILIEEARTNIIPNSNGTSGWVLTDVTPSKTLTGIERVANTAWLMTEGSAGTAICTPAGSGVTVSAGATCTISAVFKYQNCQWLRFRLYNNTGVDGINLWIDVQNGVIGSNAVGGAGVYVSSRVTDLGQGWYRFELTGTPNASYTSAILQILSAAGDGNTSRVSGAAYGLQWPMLEEKPTASLSITPTYGAAATRAADNLSTTSISWLDQTKGTWYANAIPGNQPDSTRRLIAINDGSINNQYFLARTTSRGGQIITTVAGVNDGVTASGTMADFSDAKMAMRLNSPSKTICVNGGTPNTVSATAFNTSGYTTFRLGSSGASSALWQGWVKETRYYADASASNAQLQALTT